MKKTSLITLATTIVLACTAIAGTKITVPVQAYEAKDLKNPPAYFEVSGTAAKEFDRDQSSTLSWVWFGGKITNRTSSDADYELLISFFDAKGNEIGGTSFKGTVKAKDYINIPEKQTVTDASKVRQIYSAKYLLILK